MNVDEVYLDMVSKVLDKGVRKPNRTGVDTLYHFFHSYVLDIADNFPLLTTKKMTGYVWNSLIHEIIWYLSGDHHIKEFEKHSKIWSSWADEDRNLETAYGRFWRRYPVPAPEDALPGESWAVGSPEAMSKFVTEEVRDDNRVVLTFDQIAYILHELEYNPYSRRMVLTAWHPANACVSRLPPCHFTALFSVDPQTDALNCHLTQRSGDIGLGIPFNIACYSALTYIFAKATGRTPGRFAHTIVDAHIYCGDHEEDPYSHVPQLRKQLTRVPMPLPQLLLPEKGDRSALEYVESLTFNDFKLRNYQSHPYLKMKVAV